MERISQSRFNLQKKYSNKFLLIKYEQLLQEPQKQLENICDFIGEKFEQQQLIEKKQTSVVPEWESGWKEKASKSLDTSRAYAWERQADKNQIWTMNSLMGWSLRRMGYHGTTNVDATWKIKVVLFVKKVPYYSVLRPLSLSVLRGVRLMSKNNA